MYAKSIILTTTVQRLSTLMDKAATGFLQLFLQGAAGNGGNVLVGDEGEQPIELDAGIMIEIQDADTGDIWLKSSSGSNTVNVLMNT